MDMNKDMNKEKSKLTKLIIVAVICIIIIIICAFFKKGTLESRLFAAGFVQKDTTIYEKIESGLSLENYLSSLEDSKKNISYLLDTKLFQVTKNNQSLKDGVEKSQIITWNYNKNIITGYYSLDENKDLTYVSFEYDLNTNVYECNGDSNTCDKMRNLSIEYINEIEELFAKHKIDTEELINN